MAWRATQLSLDGIEWTCGPVDRSGMARYVHLIKSRTDPERSPRPKGGRADKAPHLTMRRSTEDHGAAIEALLADGVPRTFNRIGVELWDQEASILHEGPADVALWALVAAGRVEHTTEAPVLFRRRA